jgi:hypothetical protein
MRDYSKFIITNESVTDKYTVSVVTDVTATPTILKIEQENVGLVYFSTYNALTFFTTDTSMIVIGDNIWAEFSADNTKDFDSASLLLSALFDTITG